ncbi:DUF2971 domain-containing protein [Elizabethkingia anophelis]|uniref:DUF2971 domain-containing protein n=1 Tax=Flavobacterium lindanitolerans TaxID=428988 RepID=UPI0021A367D9|nr:DUF2971 domain-containing protein [Elizabethkingia anophelis]MCT3810904.1 DUF2971 domain-containing protein [Elizabethkingia anophelis]MCT3817998.1 DUF2971 domain-containing protein [Elizabethkingia anophelis]MCT3940236.1 DUF2971 domain-containing protein [Elizabethkingia anophelis]MCT4192498.1 DUF2971 domain-containing protein [Elizabethkingia anophelis]
MAELENILLLQVADRFEKALIGTSLNIKTDDKWQSSTSKRYLTYIDITIYRYINPIAVIEVKNKLRDKFTLAIAKDQVRSSLSVTNARFGIITDNQDFYFYDRNEKDKDFRKEKFIIIIEKLINPEKVVIDKADKISIQNIIYKAANQFLNENTSFLEFIKSKIFINRIQFDQNSNTYFFSDDDGGITSFENQFFNKMFGEFKETQICRYTGLRTIFDMLNYLSFRMNGLIGMNDKSEANYVENYLSRNNTISGERPLIKEHHKTISALNNRYITSCSRIERKDDLTLWRLYSEDATGVCLVFSVKKNNLNKYVLLQKVKYADKNGNHKELDFLKQIQIEVETLTGFKFEFRKLGYWKHFFKAYDYAVEEEIRLLIIDNNDLHKLKTDWVMTYSHSIFNPYIDFSLNSKDFPIQLKTILLGPKCPEQETNFVQIQEMIRRKRKIIRNGGIDSNLDNLKVEISKIKHYR